MNNRLKSVNSGILGFEYVKEWEVLTKGEDYILVREFSLKDGPGETPDYMLAHFYMIHSLFACDKFQTQYPNASNDSWYIITTPNTGSSTINTKAPVIIDGETLQQIVSPKGTVQDSCESKTT